MKTKNQLLVCVQEDGEHTCPIFFPETQNPIDPF
jgi:hypothetical protein